MPSELTLLPSFDEAARRAFESDWRQGQPGPIERYLPAPDHPLYLATLKELVLVDLAFAWRQPVSSSPPPLVEAYLLRFPLLQQPALLVDLLRHEYRARHQFGDLPSLAEYQARFSHVVLSLEDLQTLHGSDIRFPPLPSTDHLPTVPGYELLEELGRGGMGIVYKARQTHLGRIVALKMIRTGSQADSDEVARFRFEAEAVARLQHPNIVQIFEIGQHSNGPFFSLEFVDGGSLDRKLAGTPQPARLAAEMVTTLARAIQAAHDANILHRDLKPANVLLASDGTPKIADFGLAKRLDLPGHTLSGAVVGTPSYMAPEQASGKTRQAGPTADVWALGAILYEMLTGRPPFLGETVYDTIAQVVSQEPVPPSRIVARVPRDLETICLQCLRKEPTRRYGSAGHLAEDLRRFQDGEPILARPAGVGERLWKWARRQPVVAGLVAGIAALTVVALITITLFYLEARHQTALARGAETRVTKERDTARAEWQRAEDNLALAKKAVDDCFLLARHDPLFQSDSMRQVRQRLYERARPFYERIGDQRPNDPKFQRDLATQHFRVAHIATEMGQRSRGLEHFEKALRISHRLVEAHPENLVYQSDLADTWIGLGETQMHLGRHRAAEESLTRGTEAYRRLVKVKPADVDYQRGEAFGLNVLGVLQRERGQHDKARESLERACAIQRRIVTTTGKALADEQDLARSSYNLGLVHLDRGEHELAIARHLLALDVFRRLVAAHPGVSLYRQEQARIGYNLGHLQANLGRNVQAREHYTQARDALRQLVAAHPEVSGYHHELTRTLTGLGAVQNHQGQTRETLAAYAEARDILERLMATHPEMPAYERELAGTLSNLGYLNSRMGLRKEALASYLRARDLQMRLLMADPAHPGRGKDLAATWNHLGSLLHELGRLEEALMCYLEGRTLQRGLAATHPEVPAHQHDLAQTWNNLGNLYQDLNRAQDAFASFVQGRDLLRRLATANPMVLVYRRELATAWINLGLLQSRQQSSEAQASYAQAQDLLGKLLEGDPDDLPTRREQARVLYNLGILHRGKGDPGAALTLFLRSLEIRRQVGTKNPDVLRDQWMLADTWNNVASLQREQGMGKEAVGSATEALKLREKIARTHPEVVGYRYELASAWNNLGILQNVVDQRKEALASFTQGSEVFRVLVNAYPLNARYKRDLAFALTLRGHLLDQADQVPDGFASLNEAVPLLERVLEKDASPGVVNQVQLALQFRARLLGRLGQHRQAVADWDRILSLVPASQRNRMRLNRALSLARAGLYQEAAAEAADLGRMKGLIGSNLHDLACVWALSAGSAARDVARPLPEREKRARTYARASVEMLARAQRMGWFREAANRALLDREDLATLRDREDFQALLASPR